MARKRNKNRVEKIFSKEERDTIYETAIRIEAQGISALYRDIQSYRNRDFKQLYPPGLEIMRAMVREARSQPSNLSALILLLFLIEKSGRDNVVTASQGFLSVQLGMSTRSIRRASRALEKKRALRRIPGAGGEYAYCLNPTHVWSGKNKDKETAPFKTGIVGRRSKDGSVQDRSVRLSAAGKKQNGKRTAGRKPAPDHDLDEVAASAAQHHLPLSEPPEGEHENDANSDQVD